MTPHPSVPSPTKKQRPVSKKAGLRVPAGCGSQQRVAPGFSHPGNPPKEQRKLKIDGKNLEFEQCLKSRIQFSKAKLH